MSTILKSGYRPFPPIVKETRHCQLILKVTRHCQLILKVTKRVSTTVYVSSMHCPKNIMSLSTKTVTDVTVLCQTFV